MGAGRLPNWRAWRSHLSGCRSLHEYHNMVLHESFVAIGALGYDGSRPLRARAAYCLLKHEFLRALRWKPEDFAKSKAFVEAIGPTAAERR